MVDPSAVAVAKQGLRATAKRIRAQAFEQQGRSAAEQIAANGIAFASPPAKAVISAYLPIADEIDPLPLMLRLAGEGFRLALPVMQGKAEPLCFRRWHPGEPVAKREWGILEPLPSAPEVDPDVMLVPLLAFDAEGYRLGYGGGFYDRTLAAMRARRAVVAIGLAFDEQEVPAVPRFELDQRLDWVLTPTGPRRYVES